MRSLRAESAASQPKPEDTAEARRVPLPRAPHPEDFTSPVHHRSVVARLGVWLGIAFTVCFVTGLVSHLHQHPVSGSRCRPHRPGATG